MTSLKVIFALLLASLAAAFGATSPTRNADVAEFAHLAATTNTVVLDVRTAGEFAAGHLKNAINLNIMGTDFEEQLAKLDKDKTYLVYCASGGRSAMACVKMERLKFAAAVNLKGGIKAWGAAGQPVVK